ncbi:MAG: triose-phosphate isomerase [Puniceicoccales bacterium]|nr:triose-phosphate isomerase [Puniceicoccales bacterium]
MDYSNRIIQNSEFVAMVAGGSMRAANAKDLLMRPDIDGGLIGGASLSVQEFATIIKIASSIEERQKTCGN